MFKSISALLFAGVSAIGNTIDPSSYANIEEVVTTNLYLDIDVDFEKQQFVGDVYLNMRSIKDINSVFLDYQGIDVHEVSLWQDKSTSSFKKVNFTRHTDLNQNLGNALEITLPKCK